MSGQQHVWRIRITAACFVLVVLLLCGRLYQLQVIRHQAYSDRADAQFSINGTGHVQDRASIFFTDKNNTRVTAAVMQTGFQIALNPQEITDQEDLYTKLSLHLSIDRQIFFDTIERARKRDSRYAVIAQHVPLDVGRAILGLSLSGVVVADDRWRYYPGGELAAQTLGFVAYNGDVQEGRYGVESQYNETLVRHSDDLYQNFFVQIFGNVRSVINGDVMSGDVVTTIEPSVQAELDRTLAQYAKQWSPRLAGGIVMDPKTGEVVAISAYPTFDPNNSGDVEGSSVFSNPLVQGVYEMGSIIKPLTMAAGIDSGAVSESSTYNDRGCITVDTEKICNFDHKARGVVPMQEILSQSLNLGVSHIANRMGSSTMRDYFLNRYKLAEKSSIDLPSEGVPQMDNLQSPRTLEYDTASFGQGIAMTPIQTIRALASLANGGLMVVPHVVREIRYDSGLTKRLDWGEPTRALKPETTVTVSRMLTAVVDKALANGTIKLDGYSVAAKTGTAQIYKPGGGGYYTDRYLHSFFGYFPSYDARYVIFLFAVEPRGAQYASQTWAQHFKDLTQFIINYYNIPPDR